MSRAGPRALAGPAALAAYPLAALVVTTVVGGRQPAHWKPRMLTPETLLEPALGTGALGLLALAAALAGPLVLPPHAAATSAAAALIVGLLFAPGVTTAIFETTGLGRPLWRLTWALPCAALLGALTTELLARRGHLLLRLAPAAAACCALAVWGTPVWEGAHTRFADRPSLKRRPHDLAAARAILAVARPGDLVLARERLSQTLLMLSAEVTAVAPRRFYTSAYLRVPEALARERLVLERLVSGRPMGPGRRARVKPALHSLGVDIACVPAAHRGARGLLAAAGFRSLLRHRRLWCGRQGASTTRADSRPSPCGPESPACVAPTPVKPPPAPGSTITAPPEPGAVTARSRAPSRSKS
jgi:hypothetical protein